MKQKILSLSMIFICMWMLCPLPVFASKGISESEIVEFEKCVDGDTATFKDVNGTKLKTRFLAIDTPETVHPTKGVENFGKEASNYTCESLTNAKEIKLEYDGDSDKEDKYGRRLAWIFVDGVLLQEKLVELGYAKVAYLYGDYEYTERLQKVETKAKENKIGIWSETEETNQETEKKNEKETAKTTSSKKEKKKKKKNWLQELIDYALAEIFKYIDKILERIANFVESML
ncbi:MAG: thermonuclease family protein [Bacilli bacterium]|nr:thermonuclease family protein [Bacilli bacterium]